MSRRHWSSILSASTSTSTRRADQEGSARRFGGWKDAGPGGKICRHGRRLRLRPSFASEYVCARSVEPSVRQRHRGYLCSIYSSRTERRSVLMAQPSSRSRWTYMISIPKCVPMRVCIRTWSGRLGSLVLQSQVVSGLSLAFRSAARLPFASGNTPCLRHCKLCRLLHRRPFVRNPLYPRRLHPQRVCSASLSTIDCTCASICTSSSSLASANALLSLNAFYISTVTVHKHCILISYESL